MAILAKIEKLAGKGDCKLEGFDNKNWFVADSFSFGVERELKESGEKGGTADINIGVGELQECSIGKSMDLSSPILAQAAINGASLGTGYFAFVQTAGGDEVGSSKPMIYLLFKLDRVFIKSWSTSGDADDRPTEEVAFLYNKIAFEYVQTTDGKAFKTGKGMNWDNVRGEMWSGHGLSPQATGISIPT